MCSVEQVKEFFDKPTHQKVVRRSEHSSKVAANKARNKIPEKERFEWLVIHNGTAEEEGTRWVLAEIVKTVEYTTKVGKDAGRKDS